MIRMFPGGFAQLEEAKRLPTGVVIRLEAFVRSLSHAKWVRGRKHQKGRSLQKEQPWKRCIIITPWRKGRVGIEQLPVQPREDPVGAA
jgi:hypothetical protein